MRIGKHVLKMAVSTSVSFSSNGEYCLYSSPDGVLKLWDTATCKLSQQYTPSSHLTTTCTCLSWGPKRQMSVSCFHNIFMILYMEQKFAKALKTV